MAAAAIDNFATPSFASPPSVNRTKRRPVGSPLTHSAGLLRDNDDVEERRQRRKSKLLSNNLTASPAQASPGRGVLQGDAEKRKADIERRKSVNLSHVGMSNAQLKDHYASCIKLSSENKINTKNAFGLHLIDYMKDLLKQTQKEESSTNFQVASCTLDAGVKIYAYRVDSVHTEAYKVLGSLGRAANNQEDGDEVDEPADSQGSNDAAPTKKKKRHTGKTIESNLKNINCEQFDLDFEVDPFFQKTSAAFDEGGTAGLLSFQLRSKSDRNDLMMDSGMKVNDDAPQVNGEAAAPSSQGETSQDESMVDLSGLREMYSRLSVESMNICPQFNSFQFTGWDRNSQDVGGNVSLPDDDFEDNAHRFDQNAPIAPDPMESFEGGGGDDACFSDNDDYTECRDANQKCDIGPVIFDGKASEFSRGRDSVASDIFGLSDGQGQLQLSLNPSEYSYFSADLLTAWAGPNHWKLKARSKDKTISSDNSKKQSKQKVALRIAFDEEINLKKYFITGRGATHLKEATLEKLLVQMTVLPEDLHYEPANLFKLFIKPEISVKRQKQAAAPLKEDGGEWYDYNNPNDRENFVPLLNDDDDDYDLGGGDDNDDDQCFEGNHTQNIFLNGTGVEGGSMFAGDNLVAQPNKVRVLDINYAKAAKRIDVKKLKSAMWRLLCEAKPEEKENVENKLPQPNIASDKVSGVYSFKSMYDALPGKVSNNMAKNLSCPISFVCLLYLANEKELKLTGKSDMSDIVIEEGI